MQETIDLENHYGAQYYLPIPVVLVKGKGPYVWDIEGKQYLDMMSAYSAVSHGHSHPRLVRAVQEQASRLGVISRAYHSDLLGPMLKRACELTGFDKGAPLNSGAEAVEFAVKAARKWGYEVKKIPENTAEIIVCDNNFHGRTTTIISFSSDTHYKNHFGPFTPGFKSVPFGDIEAFSAAIEKNTAAFLFEPIQGEAGINIPPENYLSQCAEICQENKVLMIADEIQTGLGRTGKLLACEHENIKPDGVILGKALGGGMYPVSLFLGTNEIMDLFKPGDHGSTFGGNPMAMHIALEALNVLVEEQLAERSAELGAYLLDELGKIQSPLIKDIRGRGLFVALEIDPNIMKGRDVCLALMKNGLLSKETHETVVRLAPPLIISKQQLDDGIHIIKTTLAELS